MDSRSGIEVAVLEYIDPSLHDQHSLHTFSVADEYTDVRSGMELKA